MIYCFDIDGIICDSSKGYEEAIPNARVIDAINDLYFNGHTIKIYTARGKATNTNWESFTIRQLYEWGVQYHEIYFNKPSADFYIDDKLINIEDIL
jgi:CMP-N,N'-diacetyllegionaminic acid synthase